jgi:hypothetical protein
VNKKYSDDFYQVYDELVAEFGFNKKIWKKIFNVEETAVPLNKLPKTVSKSGKREVIKPNSAGRCEEVSMMASFSVILGYEKVSDLEKQREQICQLDL